MRNIGAVTVRIAVAELGSLRVTPGDRDQGKPVMLPECSGRSNPPSGSPDNPVKAHPDGVTPSRLQRTCR